MRTALATITAECLRRAAAAAPPPPTPPPATTAADDGGGAAGHVVARHLEITRGLLDAHGALVDVEDEADDLRRRVGVPVGDAHRAGDHHGGVLEAGAVGDAAAHHRHAGDDGDERDGD